MIVQEAYKAFTQARPYLEVLSCHEYDSCFVFHAVPPEFTTPDKADQVFDSLFAVNKTSGKITRFTPFDISADEYKRGKRIAIYDKK